jgi:hypothetical protein
MRLTPTKINKVLCWSNISEELNSQIQGYGFQVFPIILEFKYRQGKINASYSMATFKWLSNQQQIPAWEGLFPLGVWWHRFHAAKQQGVNYYKRIMKSQSNWESLIGKENWKCNL